MQGNRRKSLGFGFDLGLGFGFGSAFTFGFGFTLGFGFTFGFGFTLGLALAMGLALALGSDLARRCVFAMELVVSFLFGELCVFALAVDSCFREGCVAFLEIRLDLGDDSLVRGEAFFVDSDLRAD